VKAISKKGHNGEELHQYNMERIVSLVVGRRLISRRRMHRVATEVPSLIPLSPRNYLLHMKSTPHTDQPAALLSLSKHHSRSTTIIVVIRNFCFGKNIAEHSRDIIVCTHVISSLNSFIPLQIILLFSFLVTKTETTRCPTPSEPERVRATCLPRNSGNTDPSTCRNT
jgi:hypothetical protein